MRLVIVQCAVCSVNGSFDAGRHLQHQEPIDVNEHYLRSTSLLNKGYDIIFQSRFVACHPQQRVVTLTPLITINLPI